jgi:PhnB protein
MSASFAPELVIPHGIFQLDFYVAAFGAVVLRQFLNDDGSIHVSEMTIEGALFHFHEEGLSTFPPSMHGGITCIIGLMVSDVDAYMARAIAAGAVLVSPAQDYFYGYRQGSVLDPFGHRWQIEQII